MYKLLTEKPQQKVLCIDPGPIESGVVIFDGKNVLYANASYNNWDLLEFIENQAKLEKIQSVAIEQITNYGMGVGETIFQTVEFIGRFIDRAFKAGLYTTKIPRREVKILLCNSMQAKNPNVRQAILDQFPATGGGSVPQKGTKKQPGPLFGVSSHAFSAIGIGIVFFNNYHDSLETNYDSPTLNTSKRLRKIRKKKN